MQGGHTSDQIDEVDGPLGVAQWTVDAAGQVTLSDGGVSVVHMLHCTPIDSSAQPRYCSGT